MLSWIAVKTFIKKAWVWTKKYWYLPALAVYTLVLWIFFRDKAQKAIEVYLSSRQSYEDQIDAINQAHKEEIDKRDKILEEYSKVLEAIEDEYVLNKKILDEKKKKEVKELVKKHLDDPKELAKLISKEYGFEYKGKE
jgi:ABC-type transporter lipoprotein component MlaA